MKRLIQLIKYLINIGVSGVLAFYMWFEYKLWVNPPIGESKEASLDILRNGIIETGTQYAILTLIIIFGLAIITWAIQRGIEKIENKKELIILFVLNFIILTIGLAWGMIDGYRTISSEVERYF